MWQIQEKHVQCLGAFTAAVTIAAKWLVGVLIKKVLNSSVGGNGFETTALWDFVFLNNVSFQTVAGLSFGVTILLSLAMAILSSMALVRSSQTGRSLRSHILSSAVGTSGAAADTAEITHTANDLIRKVKIIEDFQAYDHPWMLVDYIIVALAFVLTFVFTWYGSLVALAMLICSELGAAAIERMRIKFHDSLNRNSKQVDARLLDVIKNGVKIKVMDMAPQEHTSLWQLEEAIDEDRQKDATLRFFRDIVKYIFIGVVPAAMTLITWPIVTEAERKDALNIGFSIFVAVLLLDEAHKGMLSLFFLHDKKVRAAEAQAAIDNFVHSNKTDAEIPDDKNEHRQNLEKEHGWKQITVPDANEVSFEKITLEYPGRHFPAVDNYSHSFERGKIHGLVGESGSGKTTLLKIMAELICPDDGRMRVWDRLKIAYVAQDQKLFARSVRENITYGAVSPVSDKDAWAALKMANINEWVSTLPNGLDEVLEDGESMISGGQLQRLQLAHLFCTGKDANLVLLDEVLSALDHTSRNLLIDRLEIFLRGKTSIVITHHSEMLRICSDVHKMVSTPRSISHRYISTQPCLESSQPDSLLLGSSHTQICDEV